MYFADEIKANAMNDKIKLIAESLLGRRLTPKDGLDCSEIESLEESLGMSLPDPLRDFHLLVGNLDIFISSFEEFVEPYVLGEKLVFLEENQGVCYWATDVQSTQNNTVFVCTDIESDNHEWYSENTNLTDFIIILMYYQCAQGGYECGSAVYESNFNSVEEYNQYLSDIVVGYLKVVEHNGLVIYQKDGTLIWHFTDEEGKLADTIYTSTRTKIE